MPGISNKASSSPSALEAKANRELLLLLLAADGLQAWGSSAYGRLAIVPVPVSCPRRAAGVLIKLLLMFNLLLVLLWLLVLQSLLPFAPLRASRPGGGPNRPPPVPSASSPPWSI